MLYPLLFTPIYKKMIWGSESWDISCRPDEMSIIENGPLANTAFNDAIAHNPAAFLGTRVCRLYEKKGFPLLVKIIEANDDLSVQVHPGDEYAAARGFKDSGKSEMWYIINAPEGANLIVGLTKNATPEKLLKDPMPYLKKLPVKKGDMIDIPAGLVHAITKGITLAEVQQNSDITFRLYDYGRKSPDGSMRRLHLKDGIAVTDFNGIHSTETVKSDTVSNPNFTVVKQKIDGKFSEKSDTETFTIFTCVEGFCEILTDSPLPCVKLSYGRSVFIPAALGPYTVAGGAILLKSC